MKNPKEPSIGGAHLEKNPLIGVFSHLNPECAAIMADIKARVKVIFDKAAGSHDWDHTLRVFHLCQRIGPAEGADMDILGMAAYLHDIGRCHEDKAKGTVCHAEKGAQMAGEILTAFPLSHDAKQRIIHCIAAHRFRGDLAPRSIEAKVLFDADKIDAIGAVGIARAYLFAGEIGAKLHNSTADIAGTKPYTPEDTGYREYRVKLSRIKDRMLTRHGKEIAEQRHAFMELFFERFLKEYHGKD
jgi:uncharacterized protein